MAETYRKAKIEAFYHRLEIRKKSLLHQLNQKELEDKHDFLKGQLTAVELILEEIDDEFEIILSRGKEGAE